MARNRLGRGGCRVARDRLVSWSPNIRRAPRRGGPRAAVAPEGTARTDPPRDIALRLGTSRRSIQDWQVWRLLPECRAIAGAHRGVARVERAEDWRLAVERGTAPPRGDWRPAAVGRDGMVPLWDSASSPPCGWRRDDAAVGDGQWAFAGHAAGHNGRYASEWGGGRWLRWKVTPATFWAWHSRRTASCWRVATKMH